MLKTHYPSERTWENIFSSYGYASIGKRQAEVEACVYTNYSLLRLKLRIAKGRFLNAQCVWVLKD